MSAQPDFSSRAPARRAGGVPERLWVLLGGGLLVVSAAAAFSAQHRLAVARATEVDARQAAGEAQARLSGTRREEPGSLAARAQIGALAPPPRVFLELQAVMPAAVRIEQATLTYAQQAELELRVVARGARDYDEFLERLHVARAFAVLATGPEGREGEVHAVIRLHYRPEGER